MTTTRVPKYWLVKEQLRGLVDAGDPGTALPTERELAEQLATSRTTVRQAIAELVVEGLLVRTQGSGTYVAGAAAGAHPPALLVHRRPRRGAGGEPGARRHGRARDRRDRAPPRGRRRCAGSTASASSTGCRSPTSRPASAGEFPGLAAELDRRGSLYATLRDVYGVELQAVEDTVQTHLADPVTAELLGIETGHPLLLVHRLGEAAGGRPVEWTRSAYRGDRFRFVARTATAARSPASLRITPASLRFRGRRVSVSQTASRGSRDAQRPSQHGNAASRIATRRAENEDSPSRERRLGFVGVSGRGRRASARRRTDGPPSTRCRLRPTSPSRNVTTITAASSSTRRPT